MDKINTNLSIAEKISIGKAYARELFDNHEQIESVYIYGSTVRGDCLPVSDLDMHFLISKDSPPLSIEKCIHNGLVIDIEPDYKENLTVPNVLSDGYIFGLLNDAVILHDRTGFMTDLKAEVLRRENPDFSAERIAQMVFPIRRNLKEYREALESENHSELCRASGFVMWCLSDYLLAKYRRPAGGFRTLARLKVVNADAYLDILKLQESLFKTWGELKSFSPLAFWLKDPEKTDWMFENGFKDEAFHSLWICFGLSIKENKANPVPERTHQISGRSLEWLTKLGWNKDVLARKATELDNLIGRYVGGEN